MGTAMEGANIFLNLSFSIAKEINGKIANIAIAIIKLMGINLVGVDPNCTPYLIKFSIMLRRLRIRNITPAKFMNPLNFCVGDYPLKIEMCFTLLGTKAKQLLYFRFLSMESLISEMAAFEDFIVTIFTWNIYPLFLAGGMYNIVISVSEFYAGACSPCRLKSITLVLTLHNGLLLSTRKLRFIRSIMT